MVSAAARLKAMWDAPGIVRLPGAYNGMTALQAKRAGFEACYMSGAAMSASMGLPDLGFLGKADVEFFLRQVVRASDLPAVVDADTGYGGVLNVIDAVRTFEDAGAAAIHIEDQSLPKKCGHLNDKNLIEAEEMASKIAAAVAARRELLIIARTDAAASEGLDAAIARAKLYVEAGADAIFPEALTTREMFEAFAQAIDVPLLANMTEFGRTPHMSGSEFEQLGFKMVIWPVSAFRVAAKAQENLYAHLKAHDRLDGLLDHMQTRAELYDTIRYDEFENLDKTLKKTVLTEVMRGRAGH
ncbi:MAG: methylisocitrate lyase [Pelagibacterium sp.]|uniref:methylisocitrate lyase n=1 Tax=Pelagibacterium sp. TaxID=1967288 RepID=UPI0032EDBE69